MKFKFIGTNSLGFIHGVIYDLKIKTTKWAGKEYIEIIDKKYHRNCIYSSLTNFLLNWKEIN